MKNRTLAILALVFSILAVVSAVISSWLHFSVSNPYGPMEVCNRTLAAAIDNLMGLSVLFLPVISLIFGIFSFIMPGKKQDRVITPASLAITISVLLFIFSYLGILNPQHLTPERCEMQPDFYCNEHKLVDLPGNDIDRIKFTFQNGRGAGMVILRVTAQGTGDLSGVFCDTGNNLMTTTLSGKPGTRIETAQSLDINVLCGAGAFDNLAGSGMKKFDLNVTWYNADSEPAVNHAMSGELVDAVTRCS
jgi:hypothetical protein